ncbi:hypothetical protein NDU88_000168 [Pleurodeles waltl]|uniref:Uncharacterized protein n=1 Tax=Pleurodeles waltl TaxID=8319 RepID=A0AAV7KV12_PLEWA|nr:hypothetical protein NDU88_000168 [Pleurodeles waltl]
MQVVLVPGGVGVHSAVRQEVQVFPEGAGRSVRPGLTLLPISGTFALGPPGSPSYVLSGELPVWRGTPSPPGGGLPDEEGGGEGRKTGGRGGAGPTPLSLFALQAAVRFLILLLPVPDAVPARPRLGGGKRALGRPCPRIDQLESAGGADPAVPAVSRLCCGGAYTPFSTPEILLPVCCLRRQPLPRLLRRSGAPGRWPRSIFVVLALQCTSDPNVSRSATSAGRGERSGSGAPGILL